jgi:nitronate monooxygenase
VQLGVREGGEVMAGFDVRSLDAPVIVAPMAGGPTTPALAAAGSNAGGLGFLAGGYLTPDAFAERITAARGLTTGPLGANLFVPQPSVARPDAIAKYAKELFAESERYGVRLGDPRFDDDGWQAKLEVVLDLKPEVVSFTFGLPEADECGRLRGAGITTVATVTTLADAEVAVARGVDAVAVQGPDAGGHRGTFDPAASPPTQPLAQLLRATTIALKVPVIAAGGLMTAVDVADVMVSGAVAAQLGTAFLLADEAGSSPVHRAALTDPQFVETAVTRCFSGRYARGLRNRFIDDHDAHAPLGYPEVHYLTSPVRAASVRAGDPHGVNVWAGTGYRKAMTGPVADIVAALI